MIVLVPGDTPVNKPVLSIVKVVLLLLHVPPVVPVLKLNVLEFVAQTMKEPPIITGTGLSVTTCVVLQPAPVVV